MTNKEKYKQAFSVLHASEDISLEVENMTWKKRHKGSVAAAAIAACVLLIGSTGTAYAANVGGIQRTVQLWIHGDQTDAVFEMKEDSTYELQYKDEDGKTVTRGGGGVAYEVDGTERPLTEEELLADINSPEVEYEKDGTVWVYYLNQKTEITDKFDDKGICYVQIKDGDEILYMTVKYQEGYACSNDKYISPEEFN